MQGFNRYFPPDFDPNTHNTLNNYHGKHALGDRARKIDKGILITRFELPFNIWCGSCEAHIGMGVRYNAEKKNVGMYHSTPIYSFRCKCHLCGNWFEIRTDPKNTRYVVESGARQKHEQWDEAENGGIVLNRKDDGQPADPFSEVEKKTGDKLAALATKDRLEELMEYSESRNSDPFALSQRMRQTFRREKAELVEQAQEDDGLRAKYSLPHGLRMVGASGGEQSEEAAVREAGREIARQKREAEAGRCRSGGLGLRLPAPRRPLPPKAAQLAALKHQLVGAQRCPRPSAPASRRPLLRATPLARPSPPIPPPVASGSALKPSLATLAGYSSD